MQREANPFSFAQLLAKPPCGYFFDDRIKVATEMEIGYLHDVFPKLCGEQATGFGGERFWVEKTFVRSHENASIWGGGSKLDDMLLVILGDLVSEI